MTDLSANFNKEKSIAIIESVSLNDAEINRNSIKMLTEAMLQGPSIEMPVKHIFHAGMYAREIVIPKDTLIVGRIHKFDHFDIMASGDITVSTDYGEPKRLKGFNLIESFSGKQKVAYTHEETVWINFNCAEERDPEEMYNYLTCGSFEEYEDFGLMLKDAISILEENDFKGDLK